MNQHQPAVEITYVGDQLSSIKPADPLPEPAYDFTQASPEEIVKAMRALNLNPMQIIAALSKRVSAEKIKAIYALLEQQQAQEAFQRKPEWARNILDRGPYGKF